MGCDIAQGWHVSRPVEGAQLTAWLAGRSAATTVPRLEAA